MEQDSPEKETTHRRLFRHPWKYAESFIISAALVLLGFIIEFLTPGTGVSLPSWPANLIILLLFVAYIVFLNHFLKHPLKKWFSSVPAAIASVSVFTFLILLLGFIPQTGDRAGSFLSGSGLTAIVGSWPYLMGSLNLLFILSFTILKRLTSFTIKNAAFILNHFGLWLVLAAASLGASDVQELKMFMHEGEVTYYAADEHMKPRQPGFAVRLNDFRLEEFHPSVGIFHEQSGALISKKDGLPEAKQGSHATLMGWRIEVVKYYDNAVRDEKEYRPAAVTGAAPAAFVTATRPDGENKMSGWISPGSFMQPPSAIVLEKGKLLGMTIPRVKKYISDITVIYDSTRIEDMSIEVNKPASIMGWKVYQASYNEKKGRWSTSSMLQLVKDPWLPAVYTGIIMIIAGALYLIWMGRAR